jgi:photosystem II stability/assembly factor-like uncharacterized protein
VIGAGQHDVAVSPNDPDLLIVANDYGVWRSTDGGLSWSGLNQLLPNLRIRQILATPQGLAGTRVTADGIGLLELQPGGDKEWQPIADAQLSSQLQRDASQRRAASQQLGAEITAIGGSGEIRYAGAADGRIWISSDGGQTWRGPRPSSGNPVEGFYVDQQESRIAMAVLGGKGVHVLRTINTGVSWDDLSANLPDAAANAIAVDRSAGAAYVATDAGLFFAPVDLDRSSPAANWTPISGSLPVAQANDVKLDPGGNQLYVALDGYGVFATAAPHRLRQLRLVNAAYEIIFLRDRSCVISNSTGDTVSVVPLTPAITLTCTGTAFPADRLRVKRGETAALRNKVIAKRATVNVRGQAFLFHQFSHRSR